jgi:hypothetical protein
MSNSSITIDYEITNLTKVEWVKSELKQWFYKQNSAVAIQ